MIFKNLVFRFSVKKKNSARFLSFANGDVCWTSPRKRWERENEHSLHTAHARIPIAWTQRLVCLRVWLPGTEETLTHAHTCMGRQTDRQALTHTHTCMCMGTHTNTHACTHTHTHTHISKHTQTHTHTCMHTHTHTHRYTCTHTLLRKREILHITTTSEMTAYSHSWKWCGLLSEEHLISPWQPLINRDRCQCGVCCGYFWECFCVCVPLVDPWEFFCTDFKLFSKWKGTR